MKNPRNKNIQKPTRMTFPKRIPRGTPSPTTRPTRIPPNTTATVVNTAPIAQPKNFPTARASRNNTKRKPKNNLKTFVTIDMGLVCYLFSCLSLALSKVEGCLCDSDLIRQSVSCNALFCIGRTPRIKRGVTKLLQSANLKGIIKQKYSSFSFFSLGKIIPAETGVFKEKVTLSPSICFKISRT